MLSENLKSKIENAGWDISSRTDTVRLTKKVKKNYAEIKLYKNERYCLSYVVISKDFVEFFENKFDEFSLAKRSLERMAFGQVYSLLKK